MAEGVLLSELWVPISEISEHRFLVLIFPMISAS
jgi:hypothetical protein